MFALRRKFPDSDGFCGSQKMPEEETLQLCALAFSDLTRKPQSRRDYGDKGAIAHDFYTRDGYCYRPQKTSEPRILDSVLHEIYTKVYPICIRLSTASDLHDAHTHHCYITHAILRELDANRIAGFDFVERIWAVDIF